MNQRKGRSGRTTRAYFGLFSAALAVGFLLFLVVGATLILFVQRSSESSSLIARGYDVRSQVRFIVYLLQRSETSQRTYLLTNDPADLTDYGKGHLQFDAAINQLTPLLGAPDQIQRAQQIKQLAAERFATLDKSIALAQGGNRDAAVAMLTGAASEHDALERIVRIYDEFIATNQQRVAMRQAELESNNRWLWTTITLAMVGIAILALLVVLLTRQQIGALGKAQKELEDLNADLEQRVAERTIESEAARAQAERERQRAEALLRDVNHRVGNNLALVSSFLSLQMRALSDGPGRRALESARSRVHTIATTQRKLRLGTETEATRVDLLLQDVIADIVDALPENQRVTVDWDVAPMSVMSRDAVSLGVIVSELVVNATKYAFPDGEPGRVTIRMRARDGHVDLVVEDDGIGRPDGAAAAGETGGGLGTQIIYLLCKQFGGEPSYMAVAAEQARRGMRVEIPLPELKIVDETSVEP